MATGSFVQNAGRRALGEGLQMKLRNIVGNYFSGQLYIIISLQSNNNLFE